MTHYSSTIHGLVLSATGTQQAVVEMAVRVVEPVNDEGRHSLACFVVGVQERFGKLDKGLPPLSDGIMTQIANCSGDFATEMPWRSGDITAAMEPSFRKLGLRLVELQVSGVDLT